MTRCVKIGRAMELCKEKENDIVRISVEIPNSWGEYIDADAIKSYSRTVPSDSPFDSELKEFKEDMFF